jgi:hypothetical protein
MSGSVAAASKTSRNDSSWGIEPNYGSRRVHNQGSGRCGRALGTLHCPQGGIQSQSSSKGGRMDSEKRDFASPDETRPFENGEAQIVNMQAGTVGRLVLQPGWKWSENVKPIAGTEWCEAPHFQYHASGLLHIVMQDGTEYDAGPGEVTYLPAGHDAWVVGDEPVIVVDWHGATNYAK